MSVSLHMQRSDKTWSERDLDKTWVEDPGKTQVENDLDSFILSVQEKKCPEHFLCSLIPFRRVRRLQAIPSGASIFEADVTAQAQKALTDALGVYDLSDGFRAMDVLELPSAPFGVTVPVCAGEEMPGAFPLQSDTVSPGQAP